MAFWPFKRKVITGDAGAPNMQANVFGMPPPLSGQPDKPIRGFWPGSPPYQGSTQKLSMAHWHAAFGDADASMMLSLPQLRDRSNDLYRNSPAARGSINTLCSGVIGSGLKLQPTIDHEFLGLSAEQAEEWEANTLREWALFTENCDYMGVTNFDGLQRIAYNALQLDGDVFALLPWMQNQRSPYETKIQLIEAPRVMNGPNMTTAWGAAGISTPGSNIKFASGIERDDNGVPIAINIRTPHPGSLYQALNPRWNRVPIWGDNSHRRNVLIMANRYRIDQSRGEPILAPVIECLKQITRYSESELMAAVVNANLALFIKRPMSSPDDPNNLLQQGDPTARVEEFASGTIFIGAPGEEMNPVTASRPAMQFDPFFTAMLKQIGMALDTPFEILIKYFSSSYTAARAAIVQFEKKCSNEQKQFGSEFNQPSYEAFLEEAILKGRIKADGFFTDPAIRAAYCKAMWIGPPTGQINEGMEADAANKRVVYGQSTHTIEAAKRGLKYTDIVKQRASETALQKEYGWVPAPPAGLTQPYPNDGEVSEDQGQEEGKMKGEPEEDTGQDGTPTDGGRDGLKDGQGSSK